MEREHFRGDEAVACWKGREDKEEWSVTHFSVHSGKNTPKEQLGGGGWREINLGLQSQGTLPVTEGWLGRPRECWERVVGTLILMTQGIELQLRKACRQWPSSAGHALCPEVPQPSKAVLPS